MTGSKKEKERKGRKKRKNEWEMENEKVKIPQNFPLRPKMEGCCLRGPRSEYVYAALTRDSYKNM